MATKKQPQVTDADKAKDQIQADAKTQDADNAPLKPTIIEKNMVIPKKEGKMIATVGRVSVTGKNQTVEVSNETAKIIKGFK